MKTSVVVILASCMLTIGGHADDSDQAVLIRKAYIDVVGVPPTAQELDWYVNYLSNGYEMAVDHLLSQETYAWTEVTKEYARMVLLSPQYRGHRPIIITGAQQLRILYHAAGMHGESISPENTVRAREKLIYVARACTENDEQAVDYMAVALMGRETKREELQQLRNILRSPDPKILEPERWKRVVLKLMRFEGAMTK